jgi:hypothetical protein
MDLDRQARAPAKIVHQTTHLERKDHSSARRLRHASLVPTIWAACRSKRRRSSSFRYPIAINTGAARNDYPLPCRHPVSRAPLNMTLLPPSSLCSCVEGCSAVLVQCYSFCARQRYPSHVIQCAMHEDPMKETRSFTNGHHAPLEDNGRRQSGPAGRTAAVIGVIKLSRCRL